MLILLVAVYSIIFIFLDSLLAGCLLNVFTKEAETFELPYAVSRRAIQIILSTLIETTGYASSALFSFVVNNKHLSLSKMDVWRFLLQMIRACSLLHSLTLCFSPVQLKQSFCLTEDFSLLICISNSFTLNWFMIFLSTINTPLGFTSRLLSAE